MINMQDKREYMQDKMLDFDETVSCPIISQDLKIDLCEEFQMMGNAEFVPRVLENELAPLWVRQCEVCASMHTRYADPFAQPEMVLE